MCSKILRKHEKHFQIFTSVNFFLLVNFTPNSPIKAVSLSQQGGRLNDRPRPRPTAPPAHLVLVRAVVQLLELRVQLHELARHAVDAGVQVPVLAVLPVEVLLVAQPPLGAADPGVGPERDRAAVRRVVRTATSSHWETRGVLTTYLQEIVGGVAAPFRHLGGKQRFTGLWKEIVKALTNDHNLDRSLYKYR